VLDADFMEARDISVVSPPSMLIAVPSASSESSELEISSSSTTSSTSSAELASLNGLEENASSGLLKFIGGIPELRRRFFWCKSR
jgi:hypothetical protein